MIRRSGAALALALSLSFLARTTADATSKPPPPPPTPSCGYCQGPPPPPTPVPTLAATAIPQPTVVVSVSLAPTHVKRGKSLKLTVTGGDGDQVLMVLQYLHWKPKQYQGKIGSSGTYFRSWTVPKNAPLGKARLKVTVHDHSSGTPTVVDFTVAK